MNSSRWLDEREQRSWRAFLDGTRLLFDQIDRELNRDAGFGHGYYEILVRLSEAPARTLRMSDLADASRSSRSRLSHAVSRMEERGWVRRESCPNDGRGLLAVLTDSGAAALADAAVAHVDNVREHLFDQLTPEQVDQLGCIFGSVVRHLESLPCSASSSALGAALPGVCGGDSELCPEIEG